MKLQPTNRFLAVMPITADSNFETKCKVIREVLGEQVVLPNVQTNLLDTAIDARRAAELFKTFSMVIADLSFERPSCYFELGIAQALDIPCLLIAEEGTEIHQHSGKVFFYNSMEELKNLIEKALETVPSDDHQQ